MPSKELWQAAALAVTGIACGFLLGLLFMVVYRMVTS